MRVLFVALAALSFFGITHAAEPQRATFAGGCFWCLEPPFDKVEGVLETVSGYSGGSEEDAVYKRVGTGQTGHYEAIQIVYDPDKVDYATLLDVFWKNVDPTDSAGQFCDKGPQYRTAVFAHDGKQKQVAEKSLAALKASPPFAGDIVTELLELDSFYPAEDYHQDYYTKNPVRYKFYRYSCGRDKRLAELWGEPETDEE